jgi:LysM repeat protein
MKVSPWRSLLATLVLLLPFVALYHWQTTQPIAQAATAVGMLNGRASILRANWQTVTQAALYVGDTVRAIENVRLTFSEGTILDLDPAAAVVIKSARLEDGTLALGHQAGRLHVDTNNPLFRLEGDALTLTVQKAQFRVEISDSGDAYVIAEQGLVYSQSGGETVSVAAGDSLRSGVGKKATIDQTTPVALPPPPPPPPRTATPTPTPVPPTQPPQRIHTIVQGDTLSYLAQQYGVSVDEIMKANGITDPNKLSIGQKLIIPPAK